MGDIINFASLEVKSGNILKTDQVRRAGDGQSGSEAVFKPELRDKAVRRHFLESSSRALKVGI